MKAVVAAFNQEKALVGAFSVITNLRMELFEALVVTQSAVMKLVISSQEGSASFRDRVLVLCCALSGLW